jgi:MFS family permease
MFNSYRGLPRESKYLIYSAILPFVAYGMFYTDISFFLTSVQGLSIPLMGLIVTVIGISTFAASIPLGVLADKYGRKRLHIIGNVMASVIIAVFALTTNIAFLLVAAVEREFLKRLLQLLRMRCLRRKPQKNGAQTHIRSLVLFKVQRLALEVCSFL